MSRAPFSTYPVVGQMPRNRGRDPRTGLSQAAYMHRTKLSWGTGSYDYTRFRGDLVFSACVRPEEAPDWTANIDERWGRLDDASERCFTQLRGYHICADLLQDVTDGAWVDAMTEMVKLSAPKGMDLVADVCGHRPKDASPHVHILLSGRVLEADGYGALLPSMDQLLDDLHALYCDWAKVDVDASRIFSSPGSCYSDNPFGRGKTGRGFGFG